MKTIDRDGEVNLVKLAQKYSDADTARELLESLLWPNGPVCPHCKNSTDKPIYRLTPKATSSRPARKGLCKCGACRKQFTVTVGTIFEDSHIPIGKWLMAIFLLCSSKKGMSAHHLHRMLDITYKSAWFMAHRIRFAMGEGPLAKLLEGTVEVDETFVGWKGDQKTTSLRKTPLVALIQRGGNARTKIISNVSHKNLRQCLLDCSKDAVVIGSAFEGTGSREKLPFSFGSEHQCPAGEERESVRKRSKKGPPRNNERLTLHPLKFEDAVRALLATPPPPSSKKAKQ